MTHEPVVLDVAGPAAPGGAPVGDIKCEAREFIETHIHVGLVIYIGGDRVTVPAYVGINDDTCLYWLHTHADSGVIHVESPDKDRVFTLGDFFAVWGYPIGPTELAGVGTPVHAWADDKPVTGDPADIPLVDGQTIVLSDTDIPLDELPRVDTVNQL